MVWSVRRAVPADAEAIARINVNGWRAAYAGILPETVLGTLDITELATKQGESLHSPEPAATFVAIEGDRMGAFCGVRPVRHVERDQHPRLRTAELSSLYADPDMQGRGAGGSVHDAALQHLANTGIEHAVLWVLEANDAAQHFYHQRGWRPDGARGHYNAGGHGVAIVRFSRSATGF